MSEGRAVVGGHRFRARLGGVGTLGAIEERIGRKLVRLLAADSSEGARLLRNGDVDLIGPDGEPLGRLTPQEAAHRLRARLEERLHASGAADDREALRDGLRSLEDWSRRVGATGPPGTDPLSRRRF